MTAIDLGQEIDGSATIEDVKSSFKVHVIHIDSSAQAAVEILFFVERLEQLEKEGKLVRWQFFKC